MHQRDFPIGEWEIWLRGERGSSANTLAAYRTALARYFEWLDSRDADVSVITAEDIQTFVADCSAAGLGANSCRQRVAAVRSVHQFLAQHYGSTEDPARLVEVPKEVKTKRTALTIDDIDKLLDTAHRLVDEADSGYTGAVQARRAAILETLYASGMGVTELISLPASVGSSMQSEITIETRGRLRQVFLHTKALDAIQLWRSRAEQYGKVSQTYLFHSFHEREGALTRQQVHADIKRCAEDAELDPHLCSPRSLRLAFGAHLLARGAYVQDVQAMLGIACSDGMDIYQP